MSDILIENLEDGLLTIQLNRPAEGNALSRALRQSLANAVRAAAHDDSIAAVLLHGNGRHFCVGGDIGEMAGQQTLPEGFAGAARAIRDLRHEMEAVRWLHEMKKPTVAAISGAAAGGGLGLALACDLRIAGESARFTTAFGKVGLSGDYGGSYFLPRIVGGAKARELYLLSPKLSAEEALRIGLVNRVVPDADLLETARTIARALAKGPRVAFGYMKQNLNLAQSASLSESLDAEAVNQIASVQTADHLEAATAFLAKREPIFRGC